MRRLCGLWGHTSTWPGRRGLRFTRANECGVLRKTCSFLLVSYVFFFEIENIASSLSLVIFPFDMAVLVMAHLLCSTYLRCHLKGPKHDLLTPVFCTHFGFEDVLK